MHTFLKKKMDTTTQLLPVDINRSRFLTFLELSRSLVDRKCYQNIHSKKSVWNPSHQLGYGDISLLFASAISITWSSCASFTRCKNVTRHLETRRVIVNIWQLHTIIADITSAVFINIVNAQSFVSGFC